MGREGEPAVMATTDSDPIDVKYLGYGSDSPFWYFMYDWEWDEGYFRFCYEGTTLFFLNGCYLFTDCLMINMLILPILLLYDICGRPGSMPLNGGHG